MSRTRQDWTQPKLALGCLVLVCCAFQSGCTTRSPSVIDASHRNIISPSTGMPLVAIRAGTFAMGSPPDEPERDKNEAQHQVTLTQSLWLGSYEVTQLEFTQVMGFNPSTLRGSDRLPVETMTWFDAVSFCNRLSKLDGLEA